MGILEHGTRRTWRRPPGSSSDCAVHQLCLWASVFSPVNFEHWPKSGSADSWPQAALVSLHGGQCQAVMMFFPRNICSRQSFGPWGETHLLSWWDDMNLNPPLFMMVWILPCQEPTEHVMPNGLLVLASGSRQPHSAPRCWCASPHAPFPLPCSPLCLTTHFSWSSGTYSDASSWWNPSLNPPGSISQFFCFSHSTVPINYNASEMAVVLILKPGASARPASSPWTFLAHHHDFCPLEGPVLFPEYFFFTSTHFYVPFLQKEIIEQDHQWKTTTTCH